MAAIKQFGILVLSVFVSTVPAAHAAGHGPQGSGDDGSDAELPRTLVVMLDGVPYEVVDSLYRAGHFEAFRSPSRVVSPFPSLTGVAFPDMLGDDPPPGYEDRYFDRTANRMRGGLLDHLLAPAEHAGFRRHVDIQLDGLSATLGYVYPEVLPTLEFREVREGLEEYAESDGTLVAYIVSTDALAHRTGRNEVVRALLDLETLLEDARARSGDRLRIVLFSDHGNSFVPSRSVPLEDSLTAAGFRLVDQIEEARDVVVPRFGLVGSSFLYSATEEEPMLAAAAAGIPGVELAFYQDARGRIHALGRKGHAMVERRDDDWYRYTTVEGDPLQLAPIAERFRRTDVADAAGFAPDSAWFNATLDGPYIDALRRVTLSMQAAVDNPASVLVSYEPGYYYGNPAADLLVDVAGTHGSLRTASSVAFFMSTDIEAPPVLRSDDLPSYLPIEP